MTFRTALRLVVLGCIALFSAAIYSHSQPTLVAAVALGVAVAIVQVCAVARVNSMELPARLRARAQPYLEPGEALQAVFSAVSGPGPYLTLIIWIAAIAFSLLTDQRADIGSIKHMLGLIVTQWTVVATDRAILLLKSSAKQEEVVVTRLPRDTRLGPVSGWWATIWLNGERMFVHKKFHADVEFADKAIAHDAIVVQSEPVLDWSRRRKRISLRFRGHSRAV